MAHLSSLLPLISLFFLVLSSQASYKSCTFDCIYQFGDSISDTGNFVREFPIGAFSAFGRLPYGETLSNRATGRCSNGLLMIDYLTLAVDLPFLNPFLNKNADFTHGVNFAVAGSTALDTLTLLKKKIISPGTTSSLSVQLDWFKTYLRSICSMKTECEQRLEMTLFMMGEIGTNDYKYAFLQDKSIEEVQNLVPEVVQTIKSAAQEVIKLGARQIVVPGNFPIGCTPIYLTKYKNNDPSSYDEFKCIKSLNDLVILHNNQLQQAIQQLNDEHPDVIVVYADFYNAFQWLHRNAPYLGFDVTSIQKSCCGVGGDYDFSSLRMCGGLGVPVCPNPERRISWDGIHMTQSAYRYMAEWLIRDVKPKLQCNV